jgi:hypothetical protein
MGKKLYVIFIIMIVALITALPAAAGMSGSGVSGIQVQNLSTTDTASVYVYLYNTNGSAPITISNPSGDSINPKAAKNYYLPSIPGVDVGSYSMVAESSLPVAAIARTDWSSTGGAAIYSTVDPGNDVTIPLIVGNYGNQTSQFSIQNTNTAAAINDVTITLYGAALVAPVKVLSAQAIPAGTSVTYSMADAVWGTLPDTGWSAGFGQHGFVGSVRITSATALVVQSFIDVAGSRGVSGFTGIPTSSAATDVYCPLIRANYYGDTGISLVNPTGTAINATITFYADAGSPKQGGPFTQNISVPANSSAVAFQGPTGNSRAAGLPGGTQGSSNPTPTNDGFYGVAAIHGDGTLMAVVNDTKFGSGWSVQSQSTYNCVGSSQGGTSFALPLVRRFHLAATKLTTGIQIQNLTGSQVTVNLDLYNWDGTSQSASNPPALIIPAHGSGNFWNGSLTGLPTVPPSAGGYGWYGSAILTSTGAVAVVVSDEGNGPTAVDSANYNALNMSTP